MTLYFGATKNPDHLRGALDYISSPKYWQKINIEEESYTPLLLFRYGRTEPAYHILFDLSRPKNRAANTPRSLTLGLRLLLEERWALHRRGLANPLTFKHWLSFPVLLIMHQSNRFHSVPTYSTSSTLDR